ncbi:MAG: lamin tail domain-containing protein, partial [Candidatus Thermoplasmatota archaeon]
STTYYFYVKSVDGLGHVAIDKNASNYYKFTTAPPDYNAPVLTSGPTATVTNTTVIIKWITDEDSTSVVFYGTSTDLVYASSNLILTKNHEVTLYDLQASTTYYYEIKSEDPSENIMVANNNGAYYTFTTGTVLSLNYYLGMFHCHTELSDGEGTPDEAYAWARDTAKIDALMISDHSHMLDSDTAADPNAEITQIWNSANTYNSDGVFVAICGQENGNLGDKGFGHHNAYNTNVVMRPQTYQANGDVRHNWTNATNWLINNNTLSHFCHPRIDYGTNFDAFRYIPAADPYMFGLELLNGKRSEDYEDYYIQCLDKGWHVGALGSQDNHHKWWGNQANNYGKIPLTVFIAPSLTRANTLEALRTMQIYAVEINNTTALEVNRSDMPILSFTVNGYRMGEIFNVSTALKFNISLYKTSGNFQDVWLFEDGRVIESYYGVGTNSFIWRPTVKPKPGSHYYFVKATDTEDDRLWSTPIWVNTPVLALPDEIPSVSNVEHSCVKANFTDKVTVTAKITDDKSIARARVWYSAGSGVYGNIKMVDDGLTNSDALPNDKIYTAQIPVQENGSSVKYYVEVIDSSGQSGISPRAAPTYFYSYFVGPHVVINEVYSDAPGNETAEFIELYNPTSSEISLANWTIQDEYGGWYEDKWAFPSTASIAAGGFVVIARAAGSPIWGFIQNFSANPTYEYGYSSGLDNASIPNLIPVDADSEIKLDNSYDALHLCNAYGVLVDQVEYGSEGVGVLGTYMADPDEGKSISRDANGYDSDDCIVDFGILAAPSPFNKNNLPPKVWDVKHTAPEAGKATTVTVKIHDEAIWTTELWYSVNAGAYTKLTLSVASENLYSAEIPAQSNGTFVSYYIRVNDTEPQTTLAPENAPAENYTYLVGPHIVINEIYVNPPTDYDGAEFIELYNPTDQWINVSGWRLCDEPWEWADIWEFPADLSQTNISPKGFLVVAKDAGDPVKDNDGFYQEFGFLPDFEMVDPDRTYEFDNLSCPNLTQITQNSYDNQIRLDNYPYGDAVYLINKAGMIVDCIEYHTVLSANDTKNHAPGLVALAPWKGYSLTRDVLESDTDNCSQDFFLAPPTPKANASKTFYYFKAGWNLISVPFANTTYTNAQQLAKTIPGCKQIGKWNSTTQSFDIYTLRSWEEGFVLEAGGSYLVYVETYTGLQIYNKALTSQQVNLVAKWNSIGPLKKDIKASALATGIGANCIAIATWNTSSGRFITHPVSTGISDFVVQRGEGCFVFVSVATAWANEL